MNENEINKYTQEWYPLVLNYFEEFMNSEEEEVYDVIELIYDYYFYDNSQTAKWYEDYVNVFNSILLRKTFEFHALENNYYKFLLMCNIEPLKSNIEWGTSIRGSWFCFNKSKPWTPFTSGRVDDPILGRAMKDINEFISVNLCIFEISFSLIKDYDKYENPNIKPEKREEMLSLLFNKLRETKPSLVSL